MPQSLKRVVLSVSLLLAAALTLLVSDLHSRQGAGPAAADARVRVAVLKHTSNKLLDEVEGGVLSALAASEQWPRIELDRYSAESDLPTANAIAARITDGSYKMVISISTLSLQTVANANKSGRAVHVFGAVTDPSGAGVGIRRMDSLEKPAWLAGIGTFQPVREIFRAAKQAWPGLKVVGVVWNPVERNSEACTIRAREVSRELGIELLEATVDNSKDVREAADSLVARGVQAFWTGADVTVLSATTVLCETARRARIPVFSNQSGAVREGTLLDLGANYTEVGERIGSIASGILGGQDPAKLPVYNFMPERVMLNKAVLKQLRDPWRFDAEITRRAALILGENGEVELDRSQPAKGAAVAAAPLGRRWRIQEVSYSENVMAEDASRGLHDGLAAAGLREGRDYVLSALSAQGDMAALGSLFDTANVRGTDLFVTYSTPTLQAAIGRKLQVPLLFTVVADPFLAGAGRSDGDHLPGVTGVYTVGPYAEMAELLAKQLPRIRRVGTLYCPAEANSVANKDLFAKHAARHGIQVQAVAVNSAAELSDAALALVGRRPDAVVQVVDNLVISGFPTLARAAAQARIPLFAFQGAAAKQGAAFALARDYYEAGRDTAAMAVRVMRGEDPGRIPFSPPTTVKRFANPKSAQASGLSLPAAMLEGALQVETQAPPAAGAAQARR